MRLSPANYYFAVQWVEMTVPYPHYINYMARAVVDKRTSLNMRVRSIERRLKFESGVT